MNFTDRIKPTDKGITTYLDELKGLAYQIPKKTEKKRKRGQIYFFGLFINRCQCQKNKSVPFFTFLRYVLKNEDTEKYTIEWV